MKTRFLLVTLFSIAAAARAGDGDPEASAVSPESTALKKQLYSELMSLCGCARQTLADGRCGFSERERQAIAEKVDLGWDRERILDWYMKRRGSEIGREPFGAAALASPPGAFHQLAWAIPYALGVAGLVGLIVVARRIRRQRIDDAQAERRANTEPSLDAADRDTYIARLEDELSRVD